MKDRYFYPLAILFVIGMIYGVLTFNNPAKPLSADDIRKQGYTLSGANLAFLTAASGTSFEMATSLEGSQYVVMRAHKTPEETDPSPGVFGTLIPAYDEAFSGREVKITVRARQGGEHPAQDVFIGYFSSNTVTGWRRFALSSTYQDYSFNYVFPETLNKADYGYLGVWPDTEGKNRSVDVESFRIEINLRE